MYKRSWNTGAQKMRMRRRGDVKRIQRFGGGNVDAGMMHADRERAKTSYREAWGERGDRSDTGERLAIKDAELPIY